MKNLKNWFSRLFNRTGKSPKFNIDLIETKLELERLPSPPSFEAVVDEENDRQEIAAIKEMYPEVFIKAEEDGERGIPNAATTQYPASLREFISKCQGVYERFRAKSNRRNSKLKAELSSLERLLDRSHNARFQKFDAVLRSFKEETLRELYGQRDSAGLKVLQGKFDKYEQLKEDAKRLYSQLLKFRYKAIKPTKVFYDRIAPYWIGMMFFIGIDIPINKVAINYAGSSNPISWTISVFFSGLMIFFAHKAGSAWGEIEASENKSKRHFWLPFILGLALCVFSFGLRLFIEDTNLGFSLLVFVMYFMSTYYGYLGHKNFDFFQAERDIHRYERKCDKVQQEIELIKNKFDRMEKHINDEYRNKIESLAKAEEESLHRAIGDYHTAQSQLDDYEREIITEITTRYHEGAWLYIDSNTNARHLEGFDQKVDLFNSPLPDLDTYIMYQRRRENYSNQSADEVAPKT